MMECRGCGGMMKVSGNTSCSGVIEYYCRACSLVIIYDTKTMKIDEGKSTEHTETLRRLRLEAVAEMKRMK
jgi:hypothetical protein